MGLSLLSFTTAVNGAAAAAQAACYAILDFTVGSPFRALIEANASLLLWSQWNILQVLGITRAATSAGLDLDSWMADFNFARLPGVTASGQATVSRFSAVTSALLVAGTPFKTIDGALTFTFVADIGNSLWNAGLNGYLIPAGTYSATINVVCTTPGTAGNIQAGTLTLIAAAIAGIDTVTNASAFTNGASAETDAAFRARFQLYIAGLSDCTIAGIQSAIANVQTGILYQVVEGVDPSLAGRPGSFTAFVDDGTGAASPTVVNKVAAAINSARAAGIQSSAAAATDNVANVVMSISTGSGYTHSTVCATVAANIAASINALGFYGPESYVAIGALALDTPGCTAVTAGYTLNGLTIDLIAATGKVYRAGTVTVT